MKKILTPKQAAAMIPAGASVMIGGFMGCGSAHRVITELARLRTDNLTVITNDTSMQNGPDGDEWYGVAKLVNNRQIKRLIASHVGRNPKITEQVNDGFINLHLIPQGSFAEMIRAGGAGLGGVLTPTGIGTVVETDAENYKDFVYGKINVDGKSFLHMKPLRADFALICGYKVDTSGNVWYKGTTRNFNLVMATAADVVICEADNLVTVGDIEPENVHTFGILVDYIVSGGRA